MQKDEQEEGKNQKDKENKNGEEHQEKREDKETTTVCSCSKLPISLATGLPTTIFKRKEKSKMKPN